jgi:hypothetical protein
MSTVDRTANMDPESKAQGHGAAVASAGRTGPVIPPQQGGKPTPLTYEVALAHAQCLATRNFVKHESVESAGAGIGYRKHHDRDMRRAKENGSARMRRLNQGRSWSVPRRCATPERSAQHVLLMKGSTQQTTHGWHRLCLLYGLGSPYLTNGIVAAVPSAARPLYGPQPSSPSPLAGTMGDSQCHPT